MTAEELKNKYLAELGGYSEEEYREKIKQLANEHGVEYTEFDGTPVNESGNSFGSNNEKNKNTWLWIVLALAAASAAGYFIYQKYYAK